MELCWPPIGFSNCRVGENMATMAYMMQRIVGHRGPKLFFTSLLHWDSGMEGRAALIGGGHRVKALLEIFASPTASEAVEGGAIAAGEVG